MDRLVPAWMQRLRHYYVRHQPKHERNTPHGARRNIQRHYDLSNELFALFLDETMTYSRRCFEHRTTTLADAQQRKIDRCSTPPASGRAAGCSRSAPAGATLAVRAARRGATVTTLTLSEEQAVVARQRADAAGVAGPGRRAAARLPRRRGQYDADRQRGDDRGGRRASTGRRTSATLDRLLAPGGRVGLQAILLEHERMLATPRPVHLDHKYIFPGGALPSVRADRGDRAPTHRAAHRPSVDASAPTTPRTLRVWRERFDAHADAVDALGFDETFRRMWDFYLAYCEAGFATGYLDVVQIVLSSGT